MGNTDLAPLKERFEGIVMSGEQYPIDFDDAWQWVGYAKKQNAVELLKGNFEEGLDFDLLPTINQNPDEENLIFTPKSKNQVGHGGKREGAGRKSENYRLTVDCFKAFCMMADTEHGKEERRYYLAVEKAFVAMSKAREALPPEVKSVENFLNQFRFVMVESGKPEKGE